MAEQVYLMGAGAARVSGVRDRDVVGLARADSVPGTNAVGALE